MITYQDTQQNPSKVNCQNSWSRWCVICLQNENFIMIIKFIEYLQMIRFLSEHQKTPKQNRITNKKVLKYY